MKKLILFFGAGSLLFLSIFLSSCGDNKNEEPANFISYNGKTYSIKDGLAYNSEIDQGYLNPDEPSKITHDNILFFLTDGVLSTDENVADDSLVTDATYLLLFEIYIPVFSGNDVEIDGTYKYVNLLDLWDENHEGEFIFSLLDLSIDANGNKLIEDFDDYFFATGGTIQLTNDGNNFTMEISAPADEGGTIEGKFNGTLKFVSE